MSSPTDPASDATIRALIEEGRAVRNFIKSNRSSTLLNLFDYLLQQSLEGRRPKETEIAEEVFQESHDPASAEGSRVRVGVHRLRKKLDLYYAGKAGPRIIIPQGGYGLVLEIPEGHDSEEGPGPSPAFTGRRTISFWIAAIALVFGNVILAGFYFKDKLGVGDHTVRSTLLRNFTEEHPTKIAVGDYFMFLSKGDDGEIDEPTQDLSIYNADGFFYRVSWEPESPDRVMGDNPYTVSVDTLEAVSNLWPLVSLYKPEPVSASEINAEMMKSSNIIYVGALDALTPLIGNPLFQSSQFRCADTCYELVDKTTGKHFLSASPYLLGDKIVPRHDYGYIASLPGPSGKQILVISGTGDAGVRQMASLAMDARRLQQLGWRIGGKFGSFEALYRVRTMFAQDYQSSLVLARPLDTNRMWDKTKPMNWEPAPPPTP